MEGKWFKENRNRKEKKLLFWNVAGLDRQDLDFWKFIKEYDYVGLCETWVNEKSWNNIRHRLPDSHSWFSKHVEKIKMKGRASDGINIGKSYGEKENGRLLIIIMKI